MLRGPIFGRLVQFALPLIASGILQLLFNAADIIVIGQYAGNESLAAVGSTAPLINLLVNLFIGVSIGASVMMGKYVGAGDGKNASETLHTALTFAFYSGLLMIFVGIWTAGPLLSMMGTPDEVLPLAVRYMRIFFCGMPAFMVYNFGAAIFRAVGDTTRPLYFLLVAGIFNVVFNLVFVIAFDMGVAGVAIATVISQCISAVLVVMAFAGSDLFLRLHWKKLRLHWDKVWGMMKIGIPAGVQGAIFSISNILIQSSINSFGKIAMAGSTASGNIEGFVYMSMNAIYQTSLSFTSQNMGAKQYHRIDAILRNCLILVTAIGLTLGVSAWAFGDIVLRAYTPEAEVIQYGVHRLQVIATTYALCGMMDVTVGSLRGMGYSVGPMIVSLLGVCAFRVFWIFTVFQESRTLETLFLSYPISWALTFVLHLITYLYVRRRHIRPDAPMESAMA